MVSSINQARAGLRPARFSMAALLAFFLVGPATTDERVAGGPSTGTRFAHDTWDSTDGLAEGRVRALLPSANGHLWIGTQTGLCRFDGSRFRTFLAGELGLGRYSDVREILQTSDGTVWAAFAGGVLRYSAGRFEVFGKERGLANPSANSLAVNPAGGIWVATREAGIWLLRDGTFSQPAAWRDPGLPRFVVDVTVDRKGVLWAATDDGVWAFGPRPRRYGLSEGLPSLRTRDLLFDRNGVLWVSSRGGLSKLMGERFVTYTRRDGLPDDDVTALLEDEDAVLWIGTRTAGLNRLEGKKILPVTGEQSSAGRAIAALARDSEGAVWVGTDRGLDVYRRTAFRTFDLKAGLKEERILNVAARRAGGVWVVDARGALLVLAGGRVRAAAPPGTLAGDRIPLAETADGSLWAGGPVLKRLRGERWESYPNRGGEITAVIPDGDGLLVAQAGNTRSALASFRNGQFTPVPVAVPLLQVRRLFRDRSGQVWISTAGGGLVRTGSRGTRVFRASDGLPSDNVFGLVEDEAGSIWIATTGGLGRIRGDQALPCQGEGVPQRAMVQLALDAQGRLWIATAGGVHAIKRTDLDAVAEKRASFAPGQRYMIADGLRSIELSWRSPGQATTADGRLWYATSRGVSVVDPAAIRPDRPAPRAVIEEVLLGGQPVPLVDPLPVPASRRAHVEIRFAAPALNWRDRVSLRFRLTGSDDSWIDAETARFASYANLVPGTYTFEVAARRTQSSWGGVPAALRLRVEPYWHETMAARLAMAAAIGFGLFSAYRLRVRGLRRRQGILARTVEVRTAELRAEVNERRRAEEEVRKLNESLEARVQTRTAQLETANRELAADVAERRRAESALAEEKERLSVTLRSLTEAVITTDVAGQIVLMNPVAERCTGWTATEALGRPLADVFRVVDRFDRKPLRDPIEQLLVSRGARTTAQERALLLARSGRELLLDAAAALLRGGDGRTRGMVLVFRDITDKTRAEEHLQKMQKLEALAVLAGGVAHDFNNLLTGVFGHVELARAGLPPGPLASRLDSAIEVLADARSLTGQLLTFSSGSRLSMGPAALGELLQQRVRFVMSGSDITLTLEVPDDLWTCEMDPPQISQAIDNLLLNARQATPAGGRIAVRAKNVQLERPGIVGLAAGRYLEVEIADEGEGIPPEIRERIFEPFFTTKPAGTGLGLAITHSIVKQHGGAIAFDSPPGGGTTFRIYLCVAAGAPTPPRAPAPAGLQPGQGRVLVMDDEPVVLEIAKETLELCGYQVETAPNGEETVACFERRRTEGRPFDVVILDLTIAGGLGGVETLARLREIAPEVKAIATSGYSSGPVLADPRSFGFRGTLPKPYAIADLAATVQAVLGESETAPANRANGSFPPGGTSR